MGRRRDTYQSVVAPAWRLTSTTDQDDATCANSCGIASRCKRAVKKAGPPRNGGTRTSQLSRNSRLDDGQCHLSSARPASRSGIDKERPDSLLGLARHLVPALLERLQGGLPGRLMPSVCVRSSSCPGAWSTPGSLGRSSRNNMMRPTPRRERRQS